MPPPLGGGALALPVVGFLSIYAYALCHSTAKFGVVTRGEWDCSWGSSMTHPKGAGS